MTEVGIEPSYIGKNENLKFVVPSELFRMKLQSVNKVDSDITNKFSKYIQETFKGFQKGRETKYGNEINTNTETSPQFWHDFERRTL